MGYSHGDTNWVVGTNGSNQKANVLATLVNVGSRFLENTNIRLCVVEKNEGAVGLRDALCGEEGS